MRFYSTQYVLETNGKRDTYHGTIAARSIGEAKKLAQIRNMGETVLGVVSDKEYNSCPLPSELYKSRSLIECTHCLIFYGWIASRALIETCDSLLNDHGVIHEILHEMHHPNFYGYREEIFERLVNLESRIPGLKTYSGLRKPVNEVMKVSV